MEKNLTIKEQVIIILSLIKDIAPGRRVELRIPPYGVIQCVAGGNHRCGTPSNTVEMSGEVFLEISKKPEKWDEFIQSGQIQASGDASNISYIFREISILV